MNPSPLRLVKQQSRFTASPLRPMILSLLPLALTGRVLAALAARFERARREHDPVQYYLGWGGYWHPIELRIGITRELDCFAALAMTK